MRKSRISKAKQEKLIEYFVAGATGRCAAELVGVNFKIATSASPVSSASTSCKVIWLRPGEVWIRSPAFKTPTTSGVKLLIVIVLPVPLTSCGVPARDPFADGLRKSGTNTCPTDPRKAASKASSLRESNSARTSDNFVTQRAASRSKTWTCPVSGFSNLVESVRM
jgi:hypothetical protein